MEFGGSGVRLRSAETQFLAKRQFFDGVHGVAFQAVKRSEGPKGRPEYSPGRPGLGTLRKPKALKGRQSFGPDAGQGLPVCIKGTKPRE